MAGEGAGINTNLIAREMDSENRRFEVEKCNMSIDKIAVAAVKSKERKGKVRLREQRAVQLRAQVDMPSCSFSICV